MLTTILATVFVLGMLILIHELGHLVAALIFGIRVERFSIGYPPRAFGFKKGETDYCISWLPLGGYVKLAGMVDESLDKTVLTGESWEFQSKSWFAKFVVIAAGSFMNFMLAVFLFATLSFFVSLPIAKVGSLMDGYPAQEAGIEVGDEIISVDGNRVRTWPELSSAIARKPDLPVIIEWLHDGRKHSATLTTRLDDPGTEQGTRGIIGISPAKEFLQLNIFESVQAGFKQTYNLTGLILKQIKLLIIGQESVRSLGGPIIIAKMAGESARTGVAELFTFMAFLSLNLGLLNLLPVPVLDGGHIVFIFIEAVIRKPLPLKAKLVVQQVGMALLLLLMVFIIYNDILRLNTW